MLLQCKNGRVPGAAAGCCCGHCTGHSALGISAEFLDHPCRHPLAAKNQLPGIDRRRIERNISTALRANSSAGG
jgi:hypothetical protein